MHRERSQNGYAMSAGLQLLLRSQALFCAYKSCSSHGIRFEIPACRLSASIALLAPTPSPPPNTVRLDPWPAPNVPCRAEPSMITKPFCVVAKDEKDGRRVEGEEAKNEVVCSVCCGLGARGIGQGLHRSHSGTSSSCSQIASTPHETSATLNLLVRSNLARYLSIWQSACTMFHLGDL